MISILFVCWGNICRSAAGEIIFKSMIAKKGIAGDFTVYSAATSTEEIGNGIYPPMLAELKKRGLGNEKELSKEENLKISQDMQTERARQITKRDYEIYDYILIAEPMLQRYVERITGPDKDGKVHCLMEYAVNEGAAGDPEISDPWYTRNFAKACDDITLGCQAFLRYLGY